MKCRVCEQPLDHTPKLGELIAHPPCARFVKQATQEASERAVSAFRARLQETVREVWPEGAPGALVPFVE